jgi:hypothetical protein
LWQYLRCSDSCSKLIVIIHHWLGWINLCWKTRESVRIPILSSWSMFYLELVFLLGQDPPRQSTFRFPESLKPCETLVIRYDFEWFPK